MKEEEKVKMAEDPKRKDGEMPTRQEA